MKYQYVAILDIGGDGMFGVSIPDLPGAVGQGHTPKEAADDARDAAKIWLVDEISEGRSVPVARSADVVCRENAIAAAIGGGAMHFIMDFET